MNRNSNDIKNFCDKLATLWNDVPELRFMQMCFNVIAFMRAKEKDCFVMEDDEFMEELSEFVEKRKMFRSEMR